jgi:hypothetical protein
LTILGFGGGSNTLTATNNTGTINELFAPPPASGTDFFGVIDTAQFSSLTIAGSQGGDRLNFDGLSFGNTEIPEPTTLALLVLGLGGIGFRRGQIR